MDHDQPRVVAVIPARGGSKGIPEKNLALVGGVPLVVRAVRTALAARSIEAVFVSTDEPAIAVAAAEAGASVIERPAELATDTATSECALLHALEAIEAGGPPVDILVFIQATSPFVRNTDLDAGVEAVRDGYADVVFAAFQTYAFLWRDGDAGACGVNHDHSFRPRRQDREPHYQETGAFYIMRAAGFRKAGFRFFGTVRHQEVPEEWAIEIDTAAELERAQLLALHFPGAARPNLSDVRAVVTDFDGVHTDDRAYLTDEGGEAVAVHRGDGLGVAALKCAGLPVLILSKERHPVVSRRAEKLGVEVLQGIDDKATTLIDWATKKGIRLAQVAYLGNDVNDLSALELAGWPVAVADAHPDVLRAARLVLTRRGGHGAVREIADLVLGTHTENDEQCARRKYEIRGK